MKRHDVLVLNRSWVAVHIVDWQRCMTLIVKGQARAMDRDLVAFEMDEWIRFSNSVSSKGYAKVQTAQMAIAIPEIIILKDYDHLPRTEVKYSRQTLFQRDRNRCAYCGQQFDKRELTIDHILPQSRGGTSTWQNTVSACVKCNFKKADKTPEEAKMRLRYQPKKPGWVSPVFRMRKDHPCESWFKLIDIALIDPRD